MQSGWTAPAILDALGDPVRRVIYERLRRNPSHATLMAKHLPVTRSAVARHLGILKNAGLVESWREGQHQLYRARADGLTPLQKWIE
ncbi:MAG: HTH-type transcriptional regulator [Sphingomonas bacterium]|uniref:ArsR/SmtB family transcription factor n=1 Tax=Sphingomonas bacterium TaxID=1895847 RepID=UPI002635D1FA|nr:metalloregulator ArsR/SmtB family transcription factor [Sphingomonas bacterium]MDB5703023.1 HTH-type transcriptional regulator [Sphingomonas bacterium]